MKIQATLLASIAALYLTSPALADDQRPGATLNQPNTSTLMQGASLGTPLPSYTAPQPFWGDDSVSQTCAKGAEVIRTTAPKITPRVCAALLSLELRQYPEVADAVAYKRYFQCHVQKFIELQQTKSLPAEQSPIQQSKLPDLYRYCGDQESRSKN
ncbi:MAG: hypothetical protein ACRD3W_32480 [Terriglobales bacterium]